MSTKYDVIVIGTGQAGPSMATKLAQAGKKTAIIERKLFGGTCVNVGCIPSKTLIASARAAYIARRAADFGVIIGGDIAVDMKKVKARKDAVVKQSNEGVTNWLKKTANLTVIEGHARFIGPNKIAVNDLEIEAEQIFINVGGRALVPKIPGLEAVSYLTNSSIMEIDFLPKHLVIIGGSYIGLEFAQMYRRFGSQVTVIEAGPRIIAREDEAVSRAVQELLESEGVQFKLSAQNLKFEKFDDEISVGFDKAEPILGSHLLLAVGRLPNTDDLGLEKAGIETDSRGFIKVDDQLRTNVPGIWALGDVNGQGAFTHTAYNDYEIAAFNLLEREDRKVSDRISAYALYTDPPLARIGMSESEARKSGRKILSSKMPMSRVGRARERGETTGFMSVLVDADTHEILGASLFGIEADEVIHSLLDIMYARKPYTVISRAVHIHPTVSELIPTLLQALKPLV
jgi:pyruvate/2-oxoglutarate dehydrogenase complex dihydrolipoamide dehydrogenase (E3) component